MKTNLLSKFFLEVVVFVCGAVVMIYELIGSRVIGPYAGTSIYTWTALIGVILASLSAGYYAGGYLADKRPDTKPLALIILAGAVFIGLTSFIKDMVSLAVLSFGAQLEVTALLISLVLFAPASFLMGMVSPYAVRLRLTEVGQAGRTAGNLYAISTAGSIAGTFLAGFWIIPSLGSTASLVLLGCVLLVLSLILFGRKVSKLQALLMFFVLSFMVLSYVAVFAQKGVLVADVDTEYNRIWVFDAKDSETGKPIRALSTDPFGTQAAIFLDGTDDLVFDYTKFFRFFGYFVPEPKDVLMLGGCAYTYPRDFLKNYPNAEMDVVEIDPGMTEVARKYFGLEDERGLDIFHQDARIYLNENLKKYDVIFGDAFTSASSIPFQLTTKEAVQKEYDALRDGGVILVNIISAIEGEKGKFARAEYRTYKEVFPQVFLFAVSDPSDGNLNQNIMLVALKSDKTPDWKSSDLQIREYISHLWTKPIEEDLPVITDNYAPVEYYKRTAI